MIPDPPMLDQGEDLVVAIDEFIDHLTSSSPGQLDALAALCVAILRDRATPNERGHLDAAVTRLGLARMTRLNSGER